MPQVRAFRGKVLSLSLSLTVRVAISRYLPQIVLRAFRFSGPYPKHAAPASLFSPHLLVADVSIWATSPLGVAVRHIICGSYLFIFSPPSYVALWDSRTPRRPPGERVSWCLETSLSQLPPQDGSPSLTLSSLFLSFIFCPTSFWRQWTAFLVALCPLPVFKGCFVEFAQLSNDLWWICGEESGLLVLFLHHFRTAPHLLIS